MKFLLILSTFLFSFAAFAYQEQPMRELDRTVADYYRNANPLNVHLTLSQPSFVAGDTIFFRATVVEEFDRKLIDKNTILHVMLMNDNGEAITVEKVRLENGAASNQLVIPGSVKPGLYVLVAYHDWMKNTSPEFFFQTFVLIHGPLQFAQRKGGSLEFFPEGGHLAAGVSNRVVARGPANTIVTVTDQAGQTQASFSTNENGLGSFTFKPLAGTIYTANAQNKSYPLPQPEDGISVLIKQAENENLLAITIATAMEGVQRLRLVADADGSVYYNNLLKVEQGTVSVNVPTNEMMQGVTRISVFNDKGNLLAERKVFVLAETAFNGTITLDGSRFNTRQKVTAKIKVAGTGDVSGTIVSASVFNKTLYGGTTPTVAANLSLFGEVAGSMTNSSLGFSPENRAWREAADLLLITSSKSAEPWSEVFQKKQPSQKPINIRFTGQLINEKTGALMTDTTFVTLFLQKNVVTYQTFTNKGKFDLPLYIDFFGKDEVYYRIEKRGKPVPDVRIEIVEEPALTINWPVVEESATPDPVFVNARQQKLITNAFGYNRQAQNYKKVSSPNASIEEEIFGADEEIDLEKYLVFPTMEETIRELIPMVQHRKIKNVNTIRVYFSDINRQALEGPVYVIDGVMTDDTDYFMRLKPSEISKVKVVNTREKLKTFGAIGRGGVIMVETKLTDSFDKIARSKNSFVVHGLSAPVINKSFDDRFFKSRVPDLRTSLYWNPELKLDENGEASFTFYTSDVTGDFTLVLDGLTQSGEPVSVQQDFSVEFKAQSN